MMRYFKALLFSITVLMTTTSQGARHIAFTDPQKAAPDFQAQGEYIGRIGGEIPVGSR